MAVSSGGSFELARLIERARVGNVKNNDRSLIEPMAGVGSVPTTANPEGTMNWRRGVAALFVTLALAGCAPIGASPGQAPNAPQQQDDRSEKYTY